MEPEFTREAVNCVTEEIAKFICEQEEWRSHKLQQCENPTFVGPTVGWHGDFGTLKQSQVRAWVRAILAWEAKNV